jgi:hypothetical protein
MVSALQTEHLGADWRLRIASACPRSHFSGRRTPRWCSPRAAAPVPTSRGAAPEVVLPAGGGPRGVRSTDRARPDAFSSVSLRPRGRASPSCGRRSPTGCALPMAPRHDAVQLSPLVGADARGCGWRSRGRISPFSGRHPSEADARGCGWRSRGRISPFSGRHPSRPTRVVAESASARTLFDACCQADAPALDASRA